MRILEHFNFFNIFMVMATFAFCMMLANSLFVSIDEPDIHLTELQENVDELKDVFDPPQEEIEEQTQVDKKVQPEEQRSYIAEVSAYTDVETGCMTYNCTMANGEKAHYGAVACSRDIDLGTQVSIDGLGVFVCKDRLAERFDHRVDVFMGYGETAYNNAVDFGVKKKEVTLLR